MSCFNGAGENVVPANGQTRLARLTYEVPPSATTGAVPLTLQDTAAFDGTTSPLHDGCLLDPCIDAMINLIDAIPTTPSPTVTATAPLSPPTATPTSAGTGLPPSATPTADFFFAIDCNASLPGWQQTCTYPISVGSVHVALLVGNNTGAGASINGFTNNIRNNDKTRLIPSVGADSNSNSNPDFNEGGLAGTWTCSPQPDNDTGAGGPSISISYLNCLTDISGTLIGPGLTRLGLVRYDIEVGASAGSVLLEYDDPEPSSGNELYGYGPPSGTALISCPPVDACVPATIILTGPAHREAAGRQRRQR